ncbi:MAG: IS1634 family transposase [Candidatus Binatia bacterium]
MYLRTTKVRRSEDRVDEYIRLVESYWNNGSPRHRVICNLGRKDLLAPHAEALLRILKGEDKPKMNGKDADAIGAWDWGPMLVARHFWQELELGGIIDSLVKRSGDRGELADRALALVTNRLCEPTSEHGIARWLETDYVCDRSGQRWLPEWREDAERLASKRPRVRVKDRQLRQWYGTLDRLVVHKKQIEKKLFLRLRNLFSLQVDLVFYDLTSTYFEGKGPAGLARHGHSRDGKPRNRQVLVGLVMIDGWPIAHHVFEGNKRDSSTVQSVLKDIQERFGLRRVVFVGDRGMVTSDNIDLLRSSEQGYLVGLNRRRRPEVLRYVKRATGSWLKCPAGIAASEKAEVPKTLVQEVASDQSGVRVFVVHSDERLVYERAEREKAMQKVREQLQALQQRVAKGKLKAPEKIGAAASRVLGRNHGVRYYDWELKDGQFRYFEHPVNLEQEKALEGKYLIQTEEPNLAAIEAVEVYKELSEVERAFSQLKDVIEMRPIYHQKSHRVQAHIFVASLAFLLDRALEKKLKSAGIDISSKEAWQILRTVRVVEIDLGKGEHKRSATHGSARASRILRALGIKSLDPDATAKVGKKAA